MNFKRPCTEKGLHKTWLLDLGVEEGSKPRAKIQPVLRLGMKNRGVDTTPSKGFGEISRIIGDLL